MWRVYTYWMAALFGLTALLWGGRALAHAQGVSLGEYQLTGAIVNARIVLRADEAVLALGAIDTDQDGALSSVEIVAGTRFIDANIVQRIRISADDKPCVGKLTSAALEAPDGLAVQFAATCAAPPQNHLRLNAQLLELLPAGHLHRASMYIAGNKFDQLLVLARRDFDVPLDNAMAQLNANASVTPINTKAAGDHANASGLLSLIREGITHILSGADHLAFLFALLLLPTRKPGDPKLPPMRRFALVLSAFTVGHTAALAIATLAGIAPSPRIVEPLVALSVAAVGVEALRGQQRFQACITLPFGFIHGFAFASGLLPLGLARSELPKAVLGFNLGVELGQFLVVGAALPLLVLLRGSAVAPRLERYAAYLTVLAGAAWFITRCFGIGI
jgi:HupE / UreJ protein